LISIIIAAKDEGKTIGELISNIRANLNSFTYEIIVVDDGSTDQTRNIALQEQVRVISHEKRLGKAAAMKTGAKYASGEIIVFIDGDGAHDAGHIPQMVTAIRNNKGDLVIGSRFLDNSSRKNSPVVRTISNALAAFIISLTISFFLPLRTLFACRMKWRRVTDCTSGFRAMRKNVWENMNITSQGFEVEAEMIYEVSRHNLKIVEIPITCVYSKYARNSNLSILRDGFKTFKLLARKFLTL
ncbi:MAG: glycosyltransferase family 2 protein, partial [Dehalococcoidales bacterium]